MTNPTQAVLLYILQNIKRQTEQMRQWDGQGWHYHPLQAKRIFDLVQEAIEVSNALPTRASQQATVCDKVTDEQILKCADDYGLTVLKHERASLIGVVQELLSLHAPDTEATSISEANIRNSALEEAAIRVEQMNESAGDSASYDKREMDQWEQGSMCALHSAATRIRALKSSHAQEAERKV